MGFVGSNLDTFEINETIIEDFGFRNLGRDRDFNATNDICFDCHRGLDVLDHTLDPVSLYPRRHGH